MLVKIFEHQHETYLIKNWLKKRGLRQKLCDDLPFIGVLAHDLNDYIAAGFLRHVEKNFGLIDSLISNPDIDGKRRNEAIDAVVSKLILIAKEKGISKLLAMSVDENTLIRSKSHGFIELQYKVISKDLGD
jgi:hypothetical protein